MRKIRFSETEASILYCIPKPASTLKTIIHCYTLIERAAVPSFEVFSNCLSKAINVGILDLVEDKYLVMENWYRQIHRSDETATNEIESLIEFSDDFCKQEWDEESERGFILNRSEYDEAVRWYQSLWSSNRQEYR